jgi:hypothetical protein
VKLTDEQGAVMLAVLLSGPLSATNLREHLPEGATDLARRMIVASLHVLKGRGLLESRITQGVEFYDVTAAGLGALLVWRRDRSAQRV